MSLAPLTRIHKISLRTIQPAAEDVYKLSFDAPHIAARIKPGQFVSIAVPGNAAQLVRLPLTCAHADSNAGTIEIYLAVVGDKTRRLASLKPQDVVDALGPNGHGWKTTNAIKRALLIADNRGISSLLMLAEWFFHHNIAYDAVIGAPHVKKLIGIDRMRLFGCSQLSICTDDGSAGLKSSTEDCVRQLFATTSYDALHACGSEHMMKAVTEMAKSAHVPCQVSLERAMLCGFGACGVCTVSTTNGPACCCTRGPVFDGKEVIW